MNKIKYTASINTLASDRHLWSVSEECVPGVIREGVAPSLSKAMKAIAAAKKDRSMSIKTLLDAGK